MVFLHFYVVDNVGLWAFDVTGLLCNSHGGLESLG